MQLHEVVRLAPSTGCFAAGGCGGSAEVFAQFCTFEYPYIVESSIAELEILDAGAVFGGGRLDVEADDQRIRESRIHSRRPRRQ